MTPLAAVSSPHDGSVVVALDPPPRQLRYAAAMVTAPLAPVWSTLRVRCGSRRWRWPHTATPSRGMAMAAPACGLAGTCWRHRAHRIHARQRRRHRCPGHRPPTHLRSGARRHATRQRSDRVQSNNAGRAVYAARSGPCNSCPAPGLATRPTVTATAKQIPRTCSTRRSRPRATCAPGPQSAQSVAGSDRDPALQQLDGLRTECARLAAAYATGVEPINLPAITGPIPAIGDAHLESSRDSDRVCR